MKGLLIKDFKLLKNQKYFLLALLVISIVFLVKGEDTEFVLSYVGAMCSILILNTIAYDEYDNGMGYLFTFPIRRKDYVLEKYVFGILITSAALAAAGFSAFLLSAADYLQGDTAEILFSILLNMIVMILLQAMLIPIQLKFGSEKSRLVMMIVIFGGIAAGSVLVKAAKMFSPGISKITGYFAQAGIAVIIAAACVLAAVILAVSYSVSIAVMNRRQF